MRYAVPLLAAATLLNACNFGGSSSRTDSGAKVEESSEELSKNPFKALNQLGDAANKMAEKQKEMENRKPVDPVKFDVLIPLLPAPDGWKAEDAKGETTSMGEWKISTASRTYEKGEGDDQQRMSVNIVDGGYVPMVYAPFTMLQSFSHESTEGHSKGITIDGQPAIEEWKKKSKDAKVTVLVNDRFLVTVDGDNVDTEAVRNWVGLIDVKKVAALQ
jgi:hypothetical protein